MKRALLIASALALTACGHLDEMTKAPSDWPALKVIDHGAHGTLANCSQYTSVLTWPPLGCAVVDFDKGQCDVWAMFDWVYREELKHCAGRNHQGDDTLARAWEAHKVSEMLRYFRSYK